MFDEIRPGRASVRDGRGRAEAQVVEVRTVEEAAVAITLPVPAPPR